MNLKICTLGKNRQTDMYESTYHMVLFIQNSRKCKLIYSNREQISGCLGLWEQREGYSMGVMQNLRG